MAASLRQLPIEKVVPALATLPTFSANDRPTLDAVRVALARAIATGQDAAQLAQELSAPGPWLPVQLNSATDPSGRSSSPASTKKTKLPSWIAAAAETAVKASTVLRVAVLDRDPDWVSRLGQPATVRGQKASATYGPITIVSADQRFTLQKWVIVYLVPVQMVSFVRGTTTLLVAPIAAAGKRTKVALASGSVWLNVGSFAAGAPDDSYAGLAIQDGSLTSDVPLDFSAATVSVPAGANFKITVTPVSATATSTVAQVSPPSQMTFAFPAGQAAGANLSSFSAGFLGQTFTCAQANLPAAYSAATSTLAFPAKATQSRLVPAAQAGALVTLGGDAPVEAAGWALWVTTATPESLGNALGSGVFYLGFGPGIDVRWLGLARPEPEAAGIVVAATNFLLVWTAAGLARGITSQQKLELWRDSVAPSSMTTARAAGAGLVYEVAGVHEVLELGARLTADLDRPILASGRRTQVDIPDGLVLLSKQGTSAPRMFAFAAFPADKIRALADRAPEGPMALDNAFIKVSQPLSLAIEAKLLPSDAGASCLSASGALLVGFQFRMEFPFLPDPYTTSSIVAGPESRQPVGGLLAEVVWTAAGDVTLRLADLEHQHPALPPTSEASSDLALPAISRIPVTGQLGLGLPDRALTPVVPSKPFPFDIELPLSPLPTKATVDMAKVNPPAAPPLPAGLRMLDLSTRASQFGVEIVAYSPLDANLLLAIDGLSARTAAILAPVITLPAIAWEPMFNKAAPEPHSPTDKLAHPPNDGPLCAIGVNSVTLVPVSPIQCLSAILAGTQKDRAAYGAILSLPYGMVAGILQPMGPGGAPPPELTQPEFAVPGVDGDVSLTGALQLTLRPPPTSPTAPVFTGRTFLRTAKNNPSSGLSYGEQVLGLDVASIFSTRFTIGSSTGVPVKRYDLAGFGASLFSDWTNLNPPDPTDIIQVDFTTTVGRTSHEIVQAQSVIYPWGIKVVRTITIDRLGSGSVERTDSGWLAASDGKFEYVATASGKDISPNDVHRGLIDSLLKVRNIQEFGLPIKTAGTDDHTGAAGPVLLQPVTFDAEIAINPQHTVSQGGTTARALDQSEHVVIPATGVVGYIGLTALFHLSIDDLLNFLPANASGPIHATIDVSKSGQFLRTVAFSAEPAVDTTLGKSALVVATHGLPKLPQGSAWTVALQGPADTAPRALGPTQPICVVQPNDAPGKPGPEAHYADPSDIFRLGENPPASPANLYGFLQDVGTQKAFLAQPFVTFGSVAKQLSLRQVPSLADPGILLGAVTSFPAISSALPLQGLKDLASQLGPQSLVVDRWFDTDPSKVTPLISSSVCEVNLVYKWAPSSDPPAPTPPGRSDPSNNNQNIHVTLGNTAGPSWSMDVYGVAFQLTLPPISSTPALWIQGAFHADAESSPSFPTMQVVYDGPLAPLTKFFATIKKLASFLSPGSGGGDGLDVHFANGALTVQDVFSLPRIPFGPGYIEDISLNIGAEIDVLHQNVDFLVGIGSQATPVHWIVDPLSGTGILQAGVQDGALAVLVQLGIGLGLAIDLGIASGSASITIAFQVQVSEQEFELMLLLTGQAQVDVCGGLASASISLSCGLGLEFPLSLPPSGSYDVTAIGTASVAIHISICWVISIDFSGSWSFSHTFNVSQG